MKSKSCILVFIRVKLNNGVITQKYNKINLFLYNIQQVKGNTSMCLFKLNKMAIIHKIEKIRQCVRIS